MKGWEGGEKGKWHCGMWMFVESMILLAVGCWFPASYASHLICMMNRLSSRGALEEINASFPNISIPYLIFNNVGLDGDPCSEAS